MNQLVALQEIYESFSKGDEALQDIDPRKIGGGSSKLIAKLLKAAKERKIPEDLCTQLSEELTDIYEIKRLGDICSRAGLHATAIKSYNKALALCRDQNMRPALLNSLGQVYARQGDPARAIVYLKKAAQDFRAVGDSRGIAHVTGNIALAYRKSRDWDRAVEYCYRSLKIFEEQGDESGAAQITGNLGRIYSDMGELDLACRYLEKSLKDFQRLGDKRRAAGILDRLGRISSLKKDWDSALNYYHKSLSIFEDLGQKQNCGLVLSDLGKAYLIKGDPAKAREALERSVKMLRKERQPDYQNAVAALASAYSMMARGCLQEAGSPDQASGQKAGDVLRRASQYYARSSDSYQELASFPKTGKPEIKVAAAVTLSRSYLSKLWGPLSKEETIAVAERAISALENASVHCEGRERIEFQNLERILSGMKEVWKTELLNNEPWSLSKSLTNAVEYLIGAACSQLSGNKALCDALKSLSAALEDERSRKDPSPQLNAALSSLQGAEERFLSARTDAGKRSAALIRKASDSIAVLSGSLGDGTDLSREVIEFKPYRKTLLLIGWALMENLLSSVDKTTQAFSWDEGFHLVNSTESTEEKDELLMDDPSPLESSRKGPQSAEVDSFCPTEPVPEIEISQEEPNIGSLPCPEEMDIDMEDPVEVADATAYPSITISEAPARENCMVAASSGLVYSQQSAQILLYPDRKAIVASENRNIPGYPLNAAGMGDSQSPGLFSHEAEERSSASPKTEESRQDQASSDNGTEDGQYFIDLSGLGASKAFIGAETGIKLMKALVMVVVLLLTIEVILYLI